MVDPRNMCFIASWDTAQMNDTEVQGHCDELANIMRSLGTAENWDKTVREVLRGDVGRFS